MTNSTWEKSPEFWRSAFHQHSPALLSYLRIRSANLADAEDILQETFVRAIHATDSLKDITKIRSFLFSIAHNLLINSHQKKQPSQPLQQELPSQVPSPHRDLSDKLFSNRLDFTLKTLSAHHRKAFDLALVQGLSYKEIAQQTGWTLSTVKINVYRARKQVLQAMRDYI